MILMDVNVLVYAHREDSTRHGEFKAWLEKLINSDQSYGIADIILSGFLRIVTHPRVFKIPTSIHKALQFVSQVRDQPNARLIAPGSRHWEIFTKLCQTAGVKGNLVADAYLAALAIESGCEWFTTDRDFSRFPGLRWGHPLEVPL
jgi:hypothetical protein